MNNSKTTVHPPTHVQYPLELCLFGRRSKVQYQTKMLNAKNARAARVCSDPVLPVKWLSDPSSASCLEQMLVRGVKMTKATKVSFFHARRSI
jgi:hypothetical protein